MAAGRRNVVSLAVKDCHATFYSTLPLRAGSYLICIAWTLSLSLDNTMKLEIILENFSKIYHLGDKVRGHIVVTSDCEIKHEGIAVFLDGKVITNEFGKAVGGNSSDGDAHFPILGYAQELLKSGSDKLPTGVTRLPFQMPLEANMPEAEILETYHGVKMSIIYTLRAEIRKGRLQPNLTTQQEIYVEGKPEADPKHPEEQASFLITSDDITSAYPASLNGLSIRGHFKNLSCLIKDPLEGQLVVEATPRPIKSIEVQLIRIETLGSGPVVRETSEVQTIQIADGNVMVGIPIMIWMIFPRLFTASITSFVVKKRSMAIDFAVNIMVVLQGEHVVSKSATLKLKR